MTIFGNAGVIRSGQFGLETSQLGIPVEDVVERGSVDRRGFLCDMGDRPFRWQVTFAGIGSELALYQCEEAGFSGAIDADEPHAPAGVNTEVGGIEQQAGAPAKGKLGQAQHGAECIKLPPAGASLLGCAL